MTILLKPCRGSSSRSAPYLFSKLGDRLFRILDLSPDFGNLIFEGGHMLAEIAQNSRNRPCVPWRRGSRKPRRLLPQRFDQHCGTS